MYKFILSILFILTTDSTFSQSELSHDVYFDTDKFTVPSTEKIGYSFLFQPYKI
ncbi:hypothetical protein [Algibacter lectus]|uniref:hypothetical protein n=1 Tax=Algibacter lectus TaxID=221126 RepID=UPI001D11FD57|nr:hypothetical protein [Algibacter lectus]